MISFTNAYTILPMIVMVSELNAKLITLCRNLCKTLKHTKENVKAKQILSIKNQLKTMMKLKKSVQILRKKSNAQNGCFQKS